MVTATDTLRLAALHEGGHALVAYSLGVTVCRVSVVPEPSRLGVTVFLETDDPRDGLAVVVAGEVAESRLPYQYAAVCLRGADRDLARRYLGRLCETEYSPAFDQAVRRAAALLTRHRRALGWLADRLVEVREMDGPQLRQFLMCCIEDRP